MVGWTSGLMVTAGGIITSGARNKSNLVPLYRLADDCWGMSFARENHGVGPGGEPGQMSWTLESNESEGRKAWHLLEKVYPASWEKWSFSSVWGSWGCIGNIVWTARLPVQEKHRHGGARRAQKHTLTEVPEPVICEERGDKSFFSVEEKRPSFVFQHCHGRNTEGRAVFFQEMCDESLAGKGCKLIPRLTDSKSISASFICNINWDI